MANYVVTDTELTNIANAIRGKTGSTATLTYPSGFNSAIAGINVGYNIGGFINVTYPTGGTCTAVSEDGITLNAPDTTGGCTFAVYEPPTSNGTSWTVSYTNGNTSNSQTVTIKYGDVKDIFLNVSSTLNNNSWTIISQVARAGIGDNYWDIGDCKAVTLNGKIGSTLTLNITEYVYIIDFNHPINKTVADNNIIFSGFKNALTNGVNVCLNDSGYGNDYSANTKYFNMNHYGSSSSPYNTNYGGWKGCDFRYDILGATSQPPSVYGTTVKTTSNIGYDATQATINTPVANTLMAALPSDMRSVLRLWTRWTDNVGNQGNAEANVSACVDAGISLLAEYEIFGVRTYANQYEQNHQQQMTYYINGNSKIKYQNSASSTTSGYWECSPNYTDASSFCGVNTSGNTSYNHSKTSGGLTPIFKV